ncbi:MAG: phosphoribosylformylglycinamidine synthase subunit PurS [Bdellovibrionales bacterium]|nr:phosphoribosylformylglycinamidine synthase subunit PurS [Bdellovibrionales bacterium]
MKIGIRIMPKSEVLDSQGRAVLETLGHHNMKMNGCRIGRFVELDVPANTVQEAIAEAKRVTEFVLYNPLIETYQIVGENNG